MPRFSAISLFRFRRRTASPADPVRVEVSGATPAISGAGRVRLGVDVERLPVITVNHVIERKPLPMPASGKLVFEDPEGRRFVRHFTINYSYETQRYPVPQGYREVWIEWDFRA